MTQEQAKAILQDAELTSETEDKFHTWRLWRSVDGRLWCEFESKPEAPEYAHSLRPAGERML
jgi:hypothetical protein